MGANDDPLIQMHAARGAILFALGVTADLHWLVPEYRRTSERPELSK